MTRMSHTLRNLGVVVARTKRSRQKEVGRSRTVVTGPEKVSSEKQTGLAGLVLWAMVELRVMLIVVRTELLVRFK